MNHLVFLCLLGLATFHSHDGAHSLASSYGERGSDLGIQVFQREVHSRPLDNIVLSPHGVASILGMLLPGAHGETRKQVLTALRYKKNGSQNHPLQECGILSEIFKNTCFFICTGPYKMLRKLHKTLTAKANQDSVLIANAMFTKDGFPMEETFRATNKANFQCESRSLDFRHPQTAADEINEWVSNKTKGRSPFLFACTKEAVSLLPFPSSF